MQSVDNQLIGSILIIFGFLCYLVAGIIFMAIKYREKHQGSVNEYESEKYRKNYLISKHEVQPGEEKTVCVKCENVLLKNDSFCPQCGKNTKIINTSIA